MNARFLCIGVGNPYRSDDGVGPYIARRLEERDLGGAEVITASGEAATLAELWKRKGEVIVFDATCSGAPAGTIRRFEAKKTPLPHSFFASSTHHLGLAEAVELSRSLGNLPESLLIYGVEGHNFQTGEDLSSEVRQAGDHIVEEVSALCMNSPSSGT